MKKKTIFFENFPAIVRNFLSYIFFLISCIISYTYSDEKNVSKLRWNGRDDFAGKSGQIYFQNSIVTRVSL